MNHTEKNKETPSQLSLKHRPFLGAFGFRLFLTLASLSILLVSFVGLVGYFQAKKSIIRNATEKLAAIAHNCAGDINVWLDDRSKEITLFAEFPQVKTIVGGLSESAEISPKDLLELANLFSLFFASSAEFGAGGIFDVQGNPLIESVDCFSSANQIASLVEFQDVLISDSPILGKIQRLGDGKAGMRLLKSIRDLSGEPIAVVIVTILPAKTLYRIISDQLGASETGETYIVNEESLLIVSTNLKNKDEILQHKISISGLSDCLAGKRLLGIRRNYRGEVVLAACDNIPRTGWSLFVEMENGEAFAPLSKIRSQIIIIGGIALFLILGISVFITRRLTKPLYELAAASDQISRGHLDIQVTEDTIDEIRYLTEHFNQMVATLKKSQEKIETSAVKLQHSEKLAEIGRLVASIVHEMRNPLSSVKMNLRILEKKEALDPLSKEHLEIASGQVVRLERMLSELLEYSKPVKPNFQRVLIESLITEVKNQARSRLEEKKLTLATEIPPESIHIITDPDLLRRILDNLISNAAAASPEGGTITLEVVAGDPIIVQVVDRGKGMSLKVLEQIFEPFFTTRGEGIGLGMSNVKKFIETIGAEIEVHSIEGQGTTFTFKIPQEPY